LERPLALRLLIVNSPASYKHLMLLVRHFPARYGFVVSTPWRLIFWHRKWTSLCRTFKRGTTDRAGLHGPNVRHERRLAAGAAGGKTSARWRG
jgi:hypothetical protein